MFPARIGITTDSIPFQKSPFPMSRLQEIPLSLYPAYVSLEMDALIREASLRADAFHATGVGRRFPKYVPSDHELVHAALVTLRREGHLSGDVFCEWGCGFAVTTGMAALLGMEAHGIEIEEGLADEAERLLSDLGIDAAIHRTSYLPEGFEVGEGQGGVDLILPENTGGDFVAPDYDGLDPERVDLFFAYPWPGEEEMMMDLFSAVAGDEATLLLYTSDGEITAWWHE